MPMPQTAEIKRLEPISRSRQRLKPLPCRPGFQGLASDPHVNVAKLTALIAAEERREAVVAQRAYVSALTIMAQELPVITEAGKIIAGDRVVSTYALWEDVNEVLRPLLARNGFVLSFRTNQEGDAIVVTAVLDHCGGHQEATSLRLPPDLGIERNNVQAVGSTVSYGKRYTACALLNITTRGGDDDGRSSGGTITPAQVRMLEDQLKAVSTSPARLLRYLKLESLPLIPVSRFEEALSVLKAKSQSKNQEGAQ